MYLNTQEYNIEYIKYKNMLTISVGDKEKHQLNFNYNTFFGKMKITVDGKEHTNKMIILAGTHTFDLKIGDIEKHEIKIDLFNRLGFAFRGSIVKVFVDDKLTTESIIGKNPFMIIVLIICVSIGLILGMWLNQMIKNSFF